jgi:hypothetical protein
VIRLTTGHAARTLNYPFARREPVLALDRLNASLDSENPDP